MGNALDSFSLKQNPQFYTKFPYRKDDFPMQFQVSKSRSGVAPHIPALYMWDPVERYKGGTLHLIVDRDRSRRVVELEDLTKLYLPKIYGNGWYLEDDKDLIAVREKGMCEFYLKVDDHNASLSLDRKISQLAFIEREAATCAFLG